jgi:hypothetical protein
MNDRPPPHGGGDTRRLRPHNRRELAFDGPLGGSGSGGGEYPRERAVPVITGECPVCAPETNALLVIRRPRKVNLADFVLLDIGDGASSP